MSLWKFNHMLALWKITALYFPFVNNKVIFSIECLSAGANVTPWVKVLGFIMPSQGGEAAEATMIDTTWLTAHISAVRIWPTGDLVRIFI